MFDYLKGIVSKTAPNYVVIDCNGVGYKIYTPNPYKFKEGTTSTAYVYNHIIEDENVLYGFTTEDLAKKLCIPEYVIVNIENGEEDYWNKHDDEEIRNFIKGFFKRMVVTEYDKRNLFF